METLGQTEGTGCPGTKDSGGWELVSEKVGEGQTWSFSDFVLGLCLLGIFHWQINRNSTPSR